MSDDIYEYRQHLTDSNDLVDLLNKMSTQGWSKDQAMPPDPRGQILVVFKRKRIQSEQSQKGNRLNG